MWSGFIEVQIAKDFDSVPLPMIMGNDEAMHSDKVVMMIEKCVMCEIYHYNSFIGMYKKLPKKSSVSICFLRIYAL
jgi:hypothetical protein